MFNKNKVGRGFGSKVELDGYTFDSIKESKFYLEYVKDCGYRFDVHRKFTLYNKIELFDGLLNLRGVGYTPDFVIYNHDGSIKHVYDVKNSFTPYAIDVGAQLRFKMFAHKYGIPVQNVVLLAKGFNMKVLGTTRKQNVIKLNSVDYDLRELIESC